MAKNNLTTKELFARLDERSLNTYRVLDDLKVDNTKAHDDILKLLQKQNGRIRRNSIAIAFILGSLGISGGVIGLMNLLG